MAKKNEGTFGKGSIFDIVSSVDKTAEVLSKSRLAIIKDYISTGSYILNAAMTGSLFAGIPTGRCTILAGEKSSGKSYLALSTCRNAQKKGYTPIYIDTEAAIDVECARRVGCDVDNFIYVQLNTVTEVSNFILNVTSKILEQPENERDKVLFVIDSLGNLTSNKERDDLINGDIKQDMTRNKELKALFRTCLIPLSKIDAPLLCTSHIYKTLDLYAKVVVNGGSGAEYGNSITMLLSPSKLEDRESEKISSSKVGEYTKTGVVVKAKTEKSRFTKPQIVRFVIPFFKAPNPYVGLDQYLTWDNSGIMVKAKALSQKDFDKLTQAEQEKCKKTTDSEGNTVYAYPKDTAKTIVIREKGEVSLSKLFTPEVLTDELLHKLDEEVIKDLFELPTQGSTADIDEVFGTDEED